MGSQALACGNKDSHEISQREYPVSGMRFELETSKLWNMIGANPPRLPLPACHLADLHSLATAK